MKKYLTPSILVLSVFFFWLNSNPEVVTRYSREFLCSFVFLPCILGMLLWKYSKWVSGLLIWLGLTVTINLFSGRISYPIASIEVLFFTSLASIFYLVQRLNIGFASKPKIIIKTITYVIIFQAALGIFQYTTGIYFPFENVVGKKVAVGFLDHTSNFGMFLAIGLPFVFSFHWLAGLFVLYAIGLSWDLTAVIASVAAICLVPVGIFYYSRKLSFAPVIIAGLILIMVFFLSYKMQVLDPTASSVVDRGNVWYESLKMSNPFIGIGLGNYKVKMPKYMKEKNIEYMGDQLWDNPSNDYVRAVSEAGFPVLIFIAGFIYTTIRRYNHFINRSTLHSRTSDWEIKLYFSSFVTILILCMGYSLFLNPTNIIWAVIIIALLNSELNRREVEC